MLTIGSYMERKHCHTCETMTMHENGHCLKCRASGRNRVKESLRSNYYKLTPEQKIDYLFERLIIDAIK